jgi:hypothetical protein
MGSFFESLPGNQDIILRGVSQGPIAIYIDRELDLCAGEKEYCYCDTKVYYGTWDSIMVWDQKQSVTQIDTRKTGGQYCGNLLPDPVYGSHKSCWCDPE